MVAVEARVRAHTENSVKVCKRRFVARLCCEMSFEARLCFQTDSRQILESVWTQEFESNDISCHLDLSRRSGVNRPPGVGGEVFMVLPVTLRPHADRLEWAVRTSDSIHVHRSVKSRYCYVSQ